MQNAHHLAILVAVSLALLGCRPSKQGSTPDVDVNSRSSAEVYFFEGLEYSNESLIHHDNAGRVKVKVESAWADDNLLVLRAEFTPDDPGFHLYSSELPRSGVNGVGRPTLLEVSDPEQFREIGKLVSSKEPIHKLDEVLNLTYQVYADGAVILYLPLRFKEAPRSDFSLPVKLTYMSCSPMTCNVPIESAQEAIKISIPNTP